MNASLLKASVFLRPTNNGNGRCMMFIVAGWRLGFPILILHLE